MAHIDKFSRQELRRVLKETYREYDDPDKYENDVDPSRTHLNYSMRFKSSYEFMQALDDRVTDLINNTMGGKAPKLEPKFVSWVMTAPKCLHDDDAKLKLFFTEFYKFCQERYGKDNVIDGVVHMDETSPHMTVYIVPECISRKSGKPTISAATRFQRNELRMFHSDFDKVCEKLFGQPNLVVRTEEERLADPKNLTLRELKASQTLAEATTKAQELVAEAQRNADEIVRQADEKLKEATKRMQEAEQKLKGGGQG
jgi:flagellar hook-basal body complex protein FliE